MENIEKRIDDVLSRGVGEFIDPDNVFRKKLIAKANGDFDGEIIIKYGVDPTRPDIHLGHAVCFRKLRQLQELGCKIIFLVGDFTATIGDPTGKSKTRPEIEQEEIEKNMQSYLVQIDKIINVQENFSWIRNSDWYTPIGNIDVILDNPNDLFSITRVNPLTHENEMIRVSPKDILAKADAWTKTRMQVTHLHLDKIQDVTFANLLWSLKHITHSQLIERDMFQDRLKSGSPLFMHEMLYPVFQGLDSYLLDLIYGGCDLEVGGTDQTFNMLIGRNVMEHNNREPQSVLSFRLLEGLDGKEKMSKSLGNYIAITDTPNEMLGKIMSLPDTSIVNYFKLCTDVSLAEVEVIEAKLGTEMNPRDAKLRLAKEIVTIYHGPEEAEKAETYFVQAFSKKEIPDDIREVILSQPIKLQDFLAEYGLATSKSEARRKIEQGGVSIDGEKLEQPDALIEAVLHQGKVMKVGKKDFVKIVF